MGRIWKKKSLLTTDKIWLGGGAAHDLAVLVVLGTVARAAELVSGLVPGHHAAKVSAHSVDAEILQGVVLLGDEVGGITLEALHQLAGASRVGLDPVSKLHVVAEGILGNGATTTATGLGRGEVGDEHGGQHEEGASDRAEEEGVHELAAAHVGHETTRGHHGRGLLSGG